jgi:hypothetical protein
MNSSDLVLSIILSIAPALIIVPVVLIVASAANKKTFKSLTDKFNYSGTMPSEAFGVHSFQFGIHRIKGKGVQVIERNNSLILKITLISPIEIPFSEMESVSTQESIFKSTKIEINLKDKTLDKISFMSDAAGLNQMPGLLKISKKKEMSAEQKANLQRIKDPALRSKVTNFLRACAVIAIILITFMILNAKYGLGA